MAALIGKSGYNPLWLGARWRCLAPARLFVLRAIPIPVTSHPQQQH
jgi:hypothetical protein